MNLLIRQARICDPAINFDDIADICLEDGVIVDTPSLPEGDYQVMDGADLIITPGFLDIHVHFREPGGNASETIATGSRAAARGGFTHVVTMPNTAPTTDNPELIKETIAKGEAAGLVTILPSACATIGRRGGELTDLAALQSAGASSITDDGSAVKDESVMSELLTASAALNIPILQHAVDPAICEFGVIRDCELARTLNVPTFDPLAETSIVDRDIKLVRETGGYLHIQHISAAGTVDLLRTAKIEGLSVTSEVTPHHLALSVDDIESDDSNMKMNPPLGTERDRQALISAVAEGTITCFATDHAPHSKEKKVGGFARGAFGVTGLETAAAITYDLLVVPGIIPLTQWVAMWTTAPAAIIGMPPPSLTPGNQADLCVFRTGLHTQASIADIQGKSLNTPFIGHPVSMIPILTILKGKKTWSADDS